VQLDEVLRNGMTEPGAALMSARAAVELSKAVVGVLEAKHDEDHR